MEKQVAVKIFPILLRLLLIARYTWKEQLLSGKFWNIFSVKKSNYLRYPTGFKNYLQLKTSSWLNCRIKLYSTDRTIQGPTGIAVKKVSRNFLEYFQQVRIVKRIFREFFGCMRDNCNHCKSYSKIISSYLNHECWPLV